MIRGDIGDLGWRTIPALFVGYRTQVENLRPSFLIPLERFEDEDGETVRVLRYAKGVLDEEQEREFIGAVKEKLDGKEKIWAFPYVPFILPMLAAFFLTLVFGDLLVNLMMSF